MKDGGPAFPVPGDTLVMMEDKTLLAGMTLRDYFAGKALQVAYEFWMRDFYHEDSKCNDGSERDGITSNLELIAESAYELADAMLAERAK